MLEEILALAKSAAATLASSPAAEQAEADVKTLEGLADKHAKAAAAWADQHAQDVEADVRNWFISRVHPGLARPAEGQPSA